MSRNHPVMLKNRMTQKVCEYDTKKYKDATISKEKKRSQRVTYFMIAKMTWVIVSEVEFSHKKINKYYMQRRDFFCLIFVKRSVYSAMNVCSYPI